MLRRTSHAALAVCSVAIGSISGLLGNYLVGGFRRSLLIGFIALVLIWAVLEGIRAMTSPGNSRRIARVKQTLGVVTGEAVGADGVPADTDLAVDQSADHLGTGGRLIGLRVDAQQLDRPGQRGSDNHPS
ncbi:hypothetical protein K7640_00745 [Micromonospora sp. PLK6-60]|uniref:hypothetical protein n=1 Tax=Micromonospora sp. PLK6-60 TaxID=2873383 RepID=UPI001CA7546A|nr:hypothetical protein [Micromonospora sp. PLK6-60]MBY8870369.1 hypothetical protein [Micromonospora sp. PLK6-60]